MSPRKMQVPTEADLTQQFTQEEIISLQWLRLWYQTGGSDRIPILRSWEFLKYLLSERKLEP